MKSHKNVVFDSWFVFLVLVSVVLCVFVVLVVVLDGSLLKGCGVFGGVSCGCGCCCGCCCRGVLLSCCSLSTGAKRVF